MSEFGSGLLYPVGLFLKHAERHYNMTICHMESYLGGRDFYWSMWWYGVGDYLMDLRIPDSLPKSIKTPAKKLKALARAYRLPDGPKPRDNAIKAGEAISLCKTILFEADKLIGVVPEKGEWE